MKAEHGLFAVFLEGSRAHGRNVSREANPYRYWRAAHKAWLTGWDAWTPAPQAAPSEDPASMAEPQAEAMTPPPATEGGPVLNGVH